MIENHNLTRLENRSFEEAIQDDFGLAITGTEQVIQGYSNQVYKGNFNGNEVFIRTNKNPKIFEVEMIGYKIFQNQGIPVPKIIAYKEKPQTLEYPTIIMSKAEGVSIAESNLSEEQCDVIYEKIGKLVNKINETKLKGFGSLKNENEKLVGEFSTWREYCLSQKENNLMNLEFCIKNNIVTEEESKKIIKINEEISNLNFGEASLIHRDVHKNHIFIKKDEITGVIDLGALTASDPRYDIANSLVFQNPREQECFKKGYGDLANDSIVNKHLISILIRKIFFRSKDHIKGNVEILIPKLKEALAKVE